MEEICPYCLNRLSGSGVCPVCKKNREAASVWPHRQKPGTSLLGRYTLGVPVFENETEILYPALDGQTGDKCIVTEFFPKKWIWRGPGELKPSFYGEQAKEQYRKELAVFMETMGAVHVQGGPVRTCFCENGFGYAISPYTEGETLAQRVLEAKPPADWVKAVFSGFIKDIIRLCREGSVLPLFDPDRLILDPDGRIAFLGSGVCLPGEHGPFPAPEEFIGEEAGPCTAVYSLCGLLYFCLCGTWPHRKFACAVSEGGNRLSDMLSGRLAPYEEEALLKGLSLQKEGRFKDLSSFYASFYGSGKEKVSGDAGSVQAGPGLFIALAGVGVFIGLVMGIAIVVSTLFA